MSLKIKFLNESNEVTGKIILMQETVKKQKYKLICFNIWRYKWKMKKEKLGLKVIVFIL